MDEKPKQPGAGIALALEDRIATLVYIHGDQCLEEVAGRVAGESRGEEERARATVFGHT